ncbi:MAG: hypothetical protein ACPGQC_12065 [Limisphaerales bacterium]
MKTLKKIAAMRYAVCALLAIWMCLGVGCGKTANGVAELLHPQ